METSLQTRSESDLPRSVVRTLIVDRDRRFVASLSRFIDLHDGARVVGFGFGEVPDVSALMNADPDLVLFGIDPVSASVVRLLDAMRHRGIRPHCIGMVDFNADIYARAVGSGVIDRVMCRTELPLLLGSELARVAVRTLTGERA